MGGLAFTMPQPVLPRPYPEHLYADYDWSVHPVQHVPIHELVPSQDDVSLYHLARLINHGRPEDADPAGWAIPWQGALYLHNGHHRWTICVIRGDATFPVRIAQPLEET